MKPRYWATACAVAMGSSIFTVASCDDSTTPAPVPTATGLNKINHFVIVYLENHSFDNLYGSYPGAEGIASAQDQMLQIDSTGRVYATLPPVMDTSVSPPTVDPRFPGNLANAPFDIAMSVPADQQIDDLVHRYYQEQSQIDSGRMDKFAAVSNAEWKK